MRGESTAEQPVIRNLEDFDKNSGWMLERILFNHRGIVMLFCPW